ncbi:MAG: SUMF1/EgtB/PvdO family nonheme iron enzyme [Planctomycetota bacterium]|nr:SUMF1/EgtB/PvdO family nonheme iron enzyme [Planctomycetota bacterium]
MKHLLLILPFLTPIYPDDAGYVTVTATAAPLMQGEKEVHLARKGLSFVCTSREGKNFNILIKDWAKSLSLTIPAGCVTFSNDKPDRTVRSLQQLRFISPITAEMQAFIRDNPTNLSGAAQSAESADPIGTPNNQPGPATVYRGELPAGMTRKEGRVYWERDGAEMVAVPYGKFIFGREKEPQTLALFFIDRTEVTNARYSRFLEVTKREPPPYWSGTNQVRFGKPDQPVVGIRFGDAQAYAEWSGKSLPTEPQWEKAARGPDGSVYPWGNAEPHAGVASFDGNPQVGAPAAVGTKSRGQSIYGVFDMAGNVSEWVDGWFGPGEQFRVLKGGSWYDSARYLRSFSREDRLPGDSGIAWGFRCVLNVR